VMVLAFMMYYTAQLLPAPFNESFNGLLIMGMMVQLMIRITHRFDDAYTTNELAERMIEFEHNMNERIDQLNNKVDDIGVIEVERAQ
jgi:hypothetical protein